MKTQIREKFFRITFAEGNYYNFENEIEAKNYWTTIAESQKGKLEAIVPFGITENYSEEKEILAKKEIF